MKKINIWLFVLVLMSATTLGIMFYVYRYLKNPLGNLLNGFGIKPYPQPNPTDKLIR